MNNTRSILILDDEQGRRDGFERVCHPRPQWARTYAATAADFLDSFRQPAAHWDLISLDHDLAHDDPMDGLDVVYAMIEANPAHKPPVIVHSSNSDRAATMMGELELANWPADRVPPLGDDWLEQHWIKTAERRLVAQ